MSDRLVYYFGDGHADGGTEDTELLGGKGANLGEMTRIGVPVPPGFTITTEVCRRFLRTGDHPDGLRDQVAAALERVERETGKTLGGDDDPLLVSVRSGASVSMPGMMDTILNLGLNDDTVETLARAADDRRFAYDSYRRFVQMYGEVVLGIPRDRFEELIDRARHARGVEHDTGLTADDLEDLTARFKDLVARTTGEPFPDSPDDQLWGAIEAVFRSWNNDRAVAYRRQNRIPADLGTAVSVVAMVYGNTGDDSGTGVAFTRNPSTGEQGIFGEFLLNAQGEDVVAGIRDPVSIDRLGDALPDAYEKLLEVMERLERHYKDMQDLEFTIERGRLYLLQTRTGQRTATAAVRIAVDMLDEGLIDEDEAVLRVEAGELHGLLHPRIDPEAKAEAVATGLPASPGAAAGRAVFDPDAAVERAGEGEQVVLVRRETSPDDFHGMVAARAILTARGGMTSHAAVVARGMGKCCVAGVHELEIDEERGRFTIGEHVVEAGEWITLDGTSGRLFLGRVETTEPEPPEQFGRLMELADERRRLEVRANADTPEDAMRARKLGAEGIGLVRTEHMFFAEERLPRVRELILARDNDAREEALERLRVMQREDFEGIFRAMDGLPVTIRLLDPPLHEFLPRGEEEIRSTADALGLEADALRTQVERMRETNPMLGHRGVRLGVSRPEITRMQVRAIFEAAVAVVRDGGEPRPEIMTPLVGDVREFRAQAKIVRETADAVLDEAGEEVSYLVGTMIEVPRAALTAREIGEEAEFFSFGTNDLTQTTYGISRDDAASFLPAYVEQGIFDEDPFRVLDRDGVGRLVAMATREGRTAKADLKVGICGEHGGEPSSIEFFHETGLDYVSCSPFRVPIARLAAAQAALRHPSPAVDADKGADEGNGEAPGKRETRSRERRDRPAAERAPAGD